MVWIYLSINLVFLAIPFVLRTRREILALWATLAIVILVAGCCFLLLPSQLAYPPPGDLGASGAAFRLADRINLHYNLLPSLHVALTVCCVAALSPRAPRPGRMLLWTWALAMSVSTLLTHQHHVLDVLTGFALGLVGTRLIYDRWSPTRTS
jgi:membrane-associated phospholipid phosphatase